MDYFTACKRYSLTRYAWDTGTDEGADCATLKDAKNTARGYLRDGWETVCCIDNKARRIVFVVGDCADVYSWFAADYAGILRANA